MIDRLYYTDPYSGEFDATVVSIEPRDGRAVVRLDRSCFYPTAGGQPFDTGSLGGFQVSRFVASAEAARLPLRKRLRPARDVERERAGVGPREPQEGRPRAAGTLRLIEVEGFDLSACGGTHVARTGAIGIIAIRAWGRFKAGQRVEFLCGGRALSRFRALRDGTTAAMRLLSASVGDLPLAIERLQGEARDQRRTMSVLHTEVARHRAEALTAAAEVTSRGRLVLAAVDADASALKTMASAVVRERANPCGAHATTSGSASRFITSPLFDRFLRILRYLTSQRLENSASFTTIAS